LDGLRIEDGKAAQIIKLLCEGVGVRGASRLTGCHTRTILNVLATVGAKCEAFLDRTLCNLKVDSLQIDEIWTRVGIRESRRTPLELERGDFFTFLAVNADTKLIVSHHTDRRTAIATNCFVQDLAKRIAGRVQATTDGFQAYRDALPRFLKGRLDFATMHKRYGHDQFNTEPNRRYSPPVCLSVTIKIREGNPDRDKISTSFVERANLSVRHFNRRFTRLSLGWSRKLANHRHAISLFVAAYNFCKVHRTLGATPAVASGLTDHAWTVEELIAAASDPIQ
jgi:IS1 family transposase